MMSETTVLWLCSIEDTAQYLNMGDRSKLDSSSNPGCNIVKKDIVLKLIHSFPTCKILMLSFYLKETSLKMKFY